jgi:hypothetical protein
MSGMMLLATIAKAGKRAPAFVELRDFHTLLSIAAAVSTVLRMFE